MSGADFQDTEAELGRAPNAGASRFRRWSLVAFGVAAVAVIAGAYTAAKVAGARRTAAMLGEQAEALGAYASALRAVEGGTLPEALEAHVVRGIVGDLLAPADTEGSVAAACTELDRATRELKVQQRGLPECAELVAQLPGCGATGTSTGTGRRRGRGQPAEVGPALEAIAGCQAALDTALADHGGNPAKLELGAAPARVPPLQLPLPPEGYAPAGERPQLYVGGDQTRLVASMLRTDCPGGRADLSCRAWVIHELRDGAWNSEGVAISTMLDETGEQVPLEVVEPEGDWIRSVADDGREPRPAPLRFDDGSRLRLVERGRELIALREVEGAEQVELRRLGDAPGRCAVRYQRDGALGVLCTGRRSDAATIWYSRDGGTTWLGGTAP